MTQLMLRSINVRNTFSHSEVDEDELSHLEDDSPVLSNTATLFHAAAVNGNKRLLQKLLQEVGTTDEINKGDQFGRTPLVYSVLGDRLDCAKLLILHGASVSVSDVDGRTPLHWAAYQGSQKCVKLLLSKGADWKAKDTKGRTPLHFAASHQSSKCLSVLLKKAPKGEVQVDNPDNDSMTALHWGASYGNAEHVKMLLRAKASVKLLDLEKKTPLHWATTNRNPSVVKLILEQTNEIINWQDIEGRTALHLAVARQNEAVVKTLLVVEKCNTSLQDNMGRTPLHWAAVLENSRIVRLLLRRGADCTLVDGNGSTALHYAAQGDYSKTVEVLLSFRHVKDTPDNEGRTALMWAAGKGASAALEIMLSHHLDVHETDNSGRTALHVAAYTGDLKCVEMLLKYGASVNALDQLHHTPLFRACEMGYADVVNVLKQNKAILDLEDHEGRSPLHWAALNGHAHICLTLLTNGAQVNRGDRLGCTPLHCAAYGGFVNCMSVLIDNGADVNKLDNEGISAFHWSCSSGHLEAVKLLFRKKAFPNFKKLNGERLTPLDYAILGDHQDVAQYMIEQGGLTFRAIQDVAATTIQSCWRGYRVRKPFQKRKMLYMRHEQLKRDMKRRSSVAQEEELKPQMMEASMSSNSLRAEYMKEPKSSTDNGRRRRALYHSTSSEPDGMFQLDLELRSQQTSVHCDDDDFDEDDDYDDDSFFGVIDEMYYDDDSDGEDSLMLPTILEMSYPNEKDESSNNNHNQHTPSSRECTVIQETRMEPSEHTYLEQERKEKSQQKPEDINARIYEVLVKKTPNSASNFNRRSDHEADKFTEVTESNEASYHKPCKLSSKVVNKPTEENFKCAFVDCGKEIIVHQRTSEIASKERERRQMIRAKMEAATTIQRWYRRHRRIKQSEGSLDELRNDQQDLVRQIAALTIQLFWRKYLCRDYQQTLIHTTSSDNLSRSRETANISLPLSIASKPKKKESSARSVMDEAWTRRSRSGSRNSSISFGKRQRSSAFSPSTARKDTRSTATPRRGTSNKIRPIVPRTSKSASSQESDLNHRRKSRLNSWKS